MILRWKCGSVNAFNIPLTATAIYVNGSLSLIRQTKEAGDQTVVLQGEWFTHCPKAGPVFVE